MSSEQPYKDVFLRDCELAGALKFGTFTLKSGRVSPYFFNAGLFHTGRLANSISTAYARMLHEANLQFDVVFGPAYKGIPLAALTVDKLFGLNNSKYEGTSYSFNRKEAKDHGEGGSIVGAGLKGKKVVIIDDVITAGTAIREAITIIEKEGGELVGIVLAFDRMEKTPSGDDSKPGPSTIGQIRKQYGIPVMAILTLDDVVGFLQKEGSPDDMKKLEEYREQYKASD